MPHHQNTPWVFFVPHRPDGVWTSQYVPGHTSYIFCGTKAEASRAFEREYVRQYNSYHGRDQPSLMMNIAESKVVADSDYSADDWIRDVHDVRTNTGGTCDDFCGVCLLSSVPFDVHRETFTLLLR
jgi:hypothetical protein